MAVINKIKIGDTTYDVGVNLANATGTLPVANGGTGLTSLATPTVTWTKGTSVGPTLKIKDSLGQSSSAVAVPSATSGQSGIVTTGAQTFAGQKTFNATPIISDSYYPSFELHPTTINSTTNTYPKGVFEGSTYDNVSMWIWGDKTNSAKSRRGLVLYNYSAQSDNKKCVALRQCDTSGNWQTDLYLLHSGGGELTGQLTNSDTGSMWVYGRDKAIIRSTNATSASSWKPVTSSKTQSGSWEIGVCHPSEDFQFCYVPDSSYNKGSNDGTVTGVRIQNSGVLMGAAWNDYAEYREVNTTEPGRVVYEVGDDTLSLSTKRMMPACSIISDTFGFAIGETKKCKTPLAQAGRALAYPLEDRNSYKPGDAVCSGPNGTVSKMTTEEKVMHPECIVGYVSCVPEYEIWGENNTKVNGRIWIKV